MDSNSPFGQLIISPDVDIFVDSSLGIWIIYSGVAVRESVHPVASDGEILRGTGYGNIEGDRLNWFCDILALVSLLRFLVGSGLKCLNLLAEGIDLEFLCFNVSAHCEYVLIHCRDRPSIGSAPSIRPMSPDEGWDLGFELGC